ncbi:MAG: glycoside hydrolase family 99-like domain-containing protein [Verrucomicrobiales bacterium]|nr:glycoside hydrolase family 99-like domain-containing protein [Verrucomicrobiales bacterium]
MIKKGLTVAYILIATGCATAKGEDLSLGAYYYPWYHSDGRHWEDGYNGLSQGLKPALGEYSSRSAKTLVNHIEWSKQLGIDHWICSWWGRGSWEDETLRHHVGPALESSAPAAPKLCLFYESPGTLSFDPDKGINFDLPQNTRQLVEDFDYLARHYFNQPNYLKINGRPVLYLYLSRTFTGDYENAIALARTAAQAQGFNPFLIGDEVFWGAPDTHRISCFDAITAYNMHGPAHFAELSDWNIFLEETEAVYANYREIAKSLKVGFIPGVLPGFDARDASGDYYVIPRSLSPQSAPGSTLKAFLDLARRQTDPDLKTIVITSFNEWHEGTQIEPRKEDLPLSPLIPESASAIDRN